MLAAITTLLIPLVGEKFAKPITIAALVIAAVSLLGVAKCAYDKSVVANALNEANVDALETNNQANENAANARLEDRAAIDEMERELNDAIDEAEPSLPSAASIALNCARLRAFGRDTTTIPACSGLGGGGEADTP